MFSNQEKSSRVAKILSLAAGTFAVLSFVAIPFGHAADNPFGIKSAEGSYMVAEKCGGAEAEKEHKCGEGKCGDGKGAAEGAAAESETKSEGKCGDGKCGDGKCGDGKEKKEGASAEGKCGDGKEKKEGKCG